MSPCLLDIISILGSLFRPHLSSPLNGIWTCDNPTTSYTLYPFTHCTPSHTSYSLILHSGDKSRNKVSVHLSSLSLADCCCSLECCCDCCCCCCWSGVVDSDWVLKLSRCVISTASHSLNQGWWRSWVAVRRLPGWTTNMQWKRCRSSKDHWRTIIC